MSKSQRSCFQHRKWLTLHFQHHTVNHQFHLLKNKKTQQNPKQSHFDIAHCFGTSLTHVHFLRIPKSDYQDKQWQRIFSKKNISECFRRWNSKVVRFVLFACFFSFFSHFFLSIFKSTHILLIMSHFYLQKNLQTYWEKHMMWPQFDCLCFRINFDFAVLE